MQAKQQNCFFMTNVKANTFFMVNHSFGLARTSVESEILEVLQTAGRSPSLNAVYLNI